jgi:hypothetical protein
MVPGVVRVRDDHSGVVWCGVVIDWLASDQQWVAKTREKFDSGS